MDYDLADRVVLWYEPEDKAFHVRIPAEFEGPDDRLPAMPMQHLALLEVAGQLNADKDTVPRLANNFINRLGRMYADPGSGCEAGH